MSPTRLRWVAPGLVLLLGAWAVTPRAALGQVGAPAPTGATAGTVSSGQPRLFHPESVRLEPSSASRKVLDAIEARQLDSARALAKNALGTADPGERGRLLWLLARIDANTEAAREPLETLRQSKHPLSRWAGLRLAESLLVKSPAQALPLAATLDEGWAGASRARQLLGLALYRSGDAAKAEPILRDLLARSAGGSFPTNIALALADTLSKSRDPKDLKEALALARKVSAKAGMGESADRADELSKQILARLPGRVRAALLEPSIEDEFTRGDALLDARNYDAAFNLFVRVAKRARGEPAVACKAELAAGKALYLKRDREGAARRLTPLADRCKDHDVKAWARYYAGSSRQRLGDPRGAIAQFEALLRQTPDHSLADDVLQHLAVAYEDAGDQASMRRALERLIEHYPNGDSRAEARFSLVLAARAAHDYPRALDQLDHMLADGAPETSEGLEGRSPYWKARTLQDLERLDEAKAGYVALVRAFPLSYYAQQALARLSELEPTSATLLLSELAEPAGTSSELAFRFRSELESAPFESAIELLRVGEVSLAKQEFTYMGALGDRTDRELVWLVAAVMHELHADVDAVTLSRARLRGFRSLAPKGRARLLWRIAYPRAYQPMIEQAAQEAQVPPEFVRAIAREESGFSASAVSSALAYGLIQVIRPTARIYAAPLGLPYDPESLKRPEVNLRVGSAFIRELWRRYAQNPALVPAAYNAGYAASDRWLSERPNMALDEWVELIPYRETRRYTRRVLQTYGIYSWLDTGRLPPLAARLPSLTSLSAPAATPEANTAVSRDAAKDTSAKEAPAKAAPPAKQ